MEGDDIELDAELSNDIVPQAEPNLLYISCQMILMWDVDWSWKVGRGIGHMP